MTIGSAARSALLVLLALGLAFGASWLLFDAWWRTEGDRPAGETTDSAPEGAAPTLSGLGREPEPARVEPLTVDVDALLRDLEATPRREQWTVLARLRGPIAHEGRLARILISRLGMVHAGGYARRALRDMVPPPVESTLPLLRDPAWRVRLHALYLLLVWRGRGHDLPRLPMLDLLEDPHDSVRRLAAGMAAVGLEYDEEVARWLLDRIRPGDRGPDWGPARILARMGPEGLAHVLPLLDDGDAGLRMQGLAGLAAAPPAEIRRHVRKIGALIRDEDEDVREAALLALRPLEGDCEACLPDLLAALEDESVIVVRTALLIIEQMGPRAARAVPALVSLLDYEHDDRVAERATSLLGDLKSRPQYVLPALTEALYGAAPDVAAAALAQFGPAALPYARKVFEGGDADAQYAALHTFEVLGPVAKEIAPHLPALIEGDDIEIAQRAMRVAGRIGPDAADALPAILERLWEGDLLAPGRGAAEILMAFGRPAEKALRDGLRSPDGERRDTALRVVERCWGRSAFAFTELEPLLDATDVETRRRAVAAICVSVTPEQPSRWGHDVSETSDPDLHRRVRSLLKRMLKDEDWQVREWASETIQQIDALQKG